MLQNEGSSVPDPGRSRQQSFSGRANSSFEKRRPEVGAAQTGSGGSVSEEHCRP